MILSEVTAALKAYMLAKVAVWLINIISVKGPF